MDVLCRAGVGAQRRWWLLWDGSGLSRRNLLSPRVLADVLHVASREPRLSLLPDLLPRAGGQHGSPARGQGTLSGRLTQCQCVVQVRTRRTTESLDEPLTNA
jgi:D-alanyl-D-alanine carboxypeptidase